jgi:hypothetical protein
MAQQTGMKECIDNCVECHRVCLETLAHCLRKGGRHAEAPHVTLLQNCADICQTSARFMIAGSPLHPSTCATCAQVCAACADDCEGMADDEAMRRCAEVCRRCADSCRRMSGGRAAA